MQRRKGEKLTHILQACLAHFDSPRRKNKQILFTNNFQGLSLIHTFKDTHRGIVYRHVIQNNNGKNEIKRTKQDVNKHKPAQKTKRRKYTDTQRQCPKNNNKSSIAQKRTFILAQQAEATTAPDLLVWCQWSMEVERRRELPFIVGLSQPVSLGWAGLSYTPLVTGWL